MGRNILRSAAVMAVCLCTMVMAQGGAPFLTGTLPKLEITTTPTDIPCATNRGCSGLSACQSTMGFPGQDCPMGGEYKYVKINSVKLTVPGNTLLNVTRDAAAEDSIRRRGNSTGTQEPYPYRIKFGSKVGLFGRTPNKSWVLLSNYYDDSKALNAVGFELGRRVGLHGTPTVQFVQLTINGSNKGVYMLTDQVQVNEGRVDIDEEKGWLSEIDYHGPDHTECNSYFKTTNPCLGFFIKSPEDKTRNEYQFVRDDITALVNAVSQNSSSKAWRDLIDLESAAKYLLVQGFMANDDFYSSGGGGPGSNFIYKDHCHKRIYAGPLWDMDLSVGYFTSSGGQQCTPKPGEMFAMGCAKWNNTSLTIEPKLPFWKTIWDDPAFKAALKKVWADYGSQFQSINTFANQISTHTGISTNISSLNTWLSGRYTYADGIISQFPSNYPSGFTKQTPEAPCTGGGGGGGGPFTLTVSVNPTAGGTVTVKVGSANAVTYTSPITIAENNTQVTVTAVPNEGYTFTEWSGALTTNMETQKTQASMTWGISSDRSLIANFSDGTTPPPPPVCNNNAVQNGTFTSTSNWQLGNTGSGANATFTVSGGSARITGITAGADPYRPQLVQTGISLSSGGYTLKFTARSIGSRQLAAVVQMGASPFDAYGEQTFNLTSSDQTFSLPFTMSSSDNTAQLAFNFGSGLGSGDVIISDVCLSPGMTSVCPGFATRTAVSSRTRATLRVDTKGVTALLPANHGYTSYKLIDMQGREIKSGKIGSGVTDLRISNVKPGVVFLRLDGGARGSTTLRATAIR